MIGKDSFVALYGISGQRFLKAFLETLGVLWLGVETSSFFSQEFSVKIREYWWLFLAFGLIVGIVRAFPRLSVEARIRDTDVFVEIRVVNMFNVKARYIIGTNRTYDTSFEDGVVLPESTQGQFIQLFCASLKQVEAQIDASLEGIWFEKLERRQKNYGKRKLYPVGTVARIEGQNRIAYLLAFQMLNEYKVASAEVEDIRAALVAVWEYIRTRGDISPVCCGILGSAFSRTKATREDLVREIVRSFVRASRFGRLSDRLTIAILPSDFRKNKVDFQQLRNLVEYECAHPISYTLG